jgi:uncharacterized protein YbjT (DUF2867 family)
MTYTILRPTAFFENFTPTFQGTMFATTWKTAMGSIPLQHVSTTDIGIIAAKALLSPTSSTFSNRAISLAGEDLTFDQANEVYKQRLGKDMPTTFGILSSAFLWMVKDVGIMFQWFKDEHYAADVEECRRINPDMMDFDAYLEKKYMPQSS